VIVGNEYRHAIEYLNAFIDDEHKIRYCALDYSHVSKHRNLDVSSGTKYIFCVIYIFKRNIHLNATQLFALPSALHEVACWAVNQTGFFCSNPKWKLTSKGFIEPVDTFSPMEQTGVMRTNCIE